MAKFLNTGGLNEWIPKVIENAEEELVILVPYIKTSERLFKALKKANKNEVEILLVYKEESLTNFEKQKLLSLENLNLMHHPNLHAKCYTNGWETIIGSMNMYEYSEENNREMGILLHLKDIVDDKIDSNNKSNVLSFSGISGDEESIFEDVILEVQSIVNSAKMERPSKETEEYGFDFEILKTKKELCEASCMRLNQTFIHKKFVPKKMYGKYRPFCKDFFDHLDLIIDYRFIFKFNYPRIRIEQIFERFKPSYDEFLFEGFKFYWNHPTEPIYLYVDNKYQVWSEDTNLEEVHQYAKKGFEELVFFLRKFI